jgi:hypothetical protein
MRVAVLMRIFSPIFFVLNFDAIATRTVPVCYLPYCSSGDGCQRDRHSNEVKILIARQQC